MPIFRATWSVLPLVVFIAGVVGPAAAQTRQLPPNLLVEIAADVLSDAIAQDVDQEAPVRTSVLGRPIFGTSTTHSRSSLELIEDPDRAVLDLVVKGVTDSDVVSVKGRLQVYGANTIPFTARMRVVVDRDGIHPQAASAQAQTQSTLTGIGRNGRRQPGRFTRKIVCKRYARDKAQAEGEANRQAVQALRTKFDEEAGPPLQKAHEDFLKDQADLKKRGVHVEQLAFSTTATALRVTAGVGPAKDRLPLTAPPTPPNPATLAVRVHQSLINHIGSTYAGKTVDGEELERQTVGRLGSSGAKKAKDDKPWSITLAARQPFTVQFADHGFITLIRIQEFTSGDSAYTGMNVTARYRFQSTSRGMAAVRQAKLAVFPPGFDPNKGMKLSARQQAIRTILEKRFARIFTEEILLQDFQFQGDLGKAGPLSVSQADSRQGWLVMAWRRAKTTE